MNRIYYIIICVLALLELPVQAAEDYTGRIANPNFDNASFDGWQGDEPNMCGNGDHCAADVPEHYNRTFNTFQDLTGLPNGTYVLQAKTAFRGSWEDFKNGRPAAAKLYATVNGQTVEQPFNYGWSCLNTTPLSGETYFGTTAGEVSTYADGTTYFIPNDPSAFRLYAEHGYYDTSLTFVVTGGEARIGIKNEDFCTDGCDNWACFDSFTLTYYPDSYYEGVTFESNHIKYHTISDTEVEIVGNEGISSTNLTIPSTVSHEGNTYAVTAIAEGGLSGCYSVARLTLPEGIKTIGYQAFVYSSYTYIHIPASVTFIDDQAFLECSELTTIFVASGNRAYSSENGILFNYDKSKLIAYPGGIKKSYYDIPATVKELATSAISNNHLDYILIPPSVETSWWGGFECCHNLKTVVCQRLEPPTEWNENNFSDEIYEQATLWVPQQALQAYASANGWSRFSSIRAIPNAITITAKNHTINYGDYLPGTYEYTVTDGPISGQPTILCEATNDSNAGSYDISVQIKSMHTVCSITIIPGKLTIKKVPLTISVGNYTKKQGESLPVFRIVYRGFVRGQDSNSLTKKPKATTTATATSSPGTYAITVSGAESPNYDFIYKNGTLTVIEADAIVVTAKDYTITYGEALPTFGYTVTGGTLTGEPTISCSATSRPTPGVYDIIIRKGTVSNYNVTYTNGTLTVLKAKLDVSVGNYTKYEDEESPAFTISYNGFKYNDNENSLSKKPTAYCEAHLWSPAGDYPITLSGGESSNYDFHYINGKLTVKPVYGLNITVVGSGKVVYGNKAVTSFSHFNVHDKQAVTLNIQPNNGYELTMLTRNGSDVTATVKNGQYAISSIDQEINIVATFSETQGSFNSGGVRYKILSAPARTAIVEKNTQYKGHVAIPESVKYNGEDWSVVGIADNAFNNCVDLISIELPARLEAEHVGISLFTGCNSLAAITWNANFALNATCLGSVNNPNLLLYVKNGNFAPSGVENVVVGDKATQIILHDATGPNGNFYCPKAFTATFISYTHHYSMTSAIGGIGGWETLALPFTATKIEHDTKGAIVPFALYGGEANRRPFWLYAYGASGFTRASAIEANKPYLICMPNNSEYNDEFCLAGNVTFSAQNARVEASNDANGTSRGNKRFVPAFCMQKKQAANFALNVVNQLHSETGGHTAGSAFISDLRNISSFEAYMTTATSNARSILDIDFENVTSIPSLPQRARTGSGNTAIYTVGGLLVAQPNSEDELQRVLKTLSAGLYIMNGRIIQIKQAK